MKLIAYLDPGTGSLIIQAVLGGAAGVTMLVKTKGRRMFKKEQKAAIREEAERLATAPVDPSEIPSGPAAT